MSLLRLSGLFLAGILTLWGCNGENVTEVSYEKLDEPIGERIGPVSQYGRLIAGVNSEGKGRIYGSCKGVSDGNEVQVRGMSLYWSLLKPATKFYSDTGITTMVNDMKIEVIRAAIGTEENWGGTLGFLLDPDAQRELIDQAVKAAIKNDIYVIIDWHSHSAHKQLSDAIAFFDEMAQKYGQYNNVIFEIFNEPTRIVWEQVKAYGDTVVATIRKHSDNLILVGNPMWDQSPNWAIGKEIADSLHNIAYTFHYYANSHSIKLEGRNAEEAMNAGLSLFVSEWGTANASGKGVPDVDRNDQWQEWMDERKLSSANWSASMINEGTAAFAQESRVDSLVYTVSGELVKGYLSANPDSYKACKAK
ncbi:Cellulase (glycosyl hydrolase family 5) [Fibrobacter sp. UWH9]|uniref:glycoside hydrolase family 5 protein n=1 Tax=unclassified Fibrobacter TaxID=2634177 RepID=UPI0009145031|nr:MULTISPECIES: glycoside hydrolase family 5 protein [Fibrobacter]MCL4102950.1 hypothetical protein [Fibrobacter succinogenes]MDO4947561.1 glycoside hydrolase family 5 protein [Fibrobacter sp.]SHH69126.1 Cellulase (glycosyl hydrolase family 5) [Fibrobacter sp. UWH9]